MSCCPIQPPLTPIQPSFNSHLINSRITLISLPITHTLPISRNKQINKYGHTSDPSCHWYIWFICTFVYGEGIQQPHPHYSTTITPSTIITPSNPTTPPPTPSSPPPTTPPNHPHLHPHSFSNDNNTITYFTEQPSFITDRKWSA